MSGHLVTILCTLVSGFVFDFPTAGAQEVNLKCIGFLFSMMSEKIAAAESFPTLFPLVILQLNTSSVLWGLWQ